MQFLETSGDRYAVFRLGDGVAIVELLSHCLQWCAILRIGAQGLGPKILRPRRPHGSQRGGVDQLVGEQDDAGGTAFRLAVTFGKRRAGPVKCLISLAV